MMHTQDPRQFYYQQREVYGSHLRLLQNEEMVLRAAELRTYDKCFELAIEYGIEKGIEQGIELGKTREKKQTAINMLRNNIELNLIVDCTGLPIEAIEAIKRLYRYN